MSTQVETGEQRLARIKHELGVFDFLAEGNDCRWLIARVTSLNAAASAILDELEDQYDGAPDSPTLWMGRHIDALKKVVKP